jgi:hypothetical protein
VSQELDVTFVSGRMIRYVHIPDQVDVAQSLGAYVSPPHPPAAGPGPVVTVTLMT